MVGALRIVRETNGASVLNHRTSTLMKEPGHPAPRLPGRVFAYGFSTHKRRFLRRFAGESAVRFVRRPARVPAGSTLLLWGSHPVPQLLAQDVRVVRVEDGFLRSVGLGTELVQPLSWVMDGRGIYYDARVPSDLEHVLQTLEFTPQLVARASWCAPCVMPTRTLTSYTSLIPTWWLVYA